MKLQLNIRMVACFILVSLFLASCHKSKLHPKTIIGKGDVVSEVLYLARFNSIESKLGAKINIYESDSYYIEISMQENLISYFEAEVKGGVLLLSFGEYNVRSRKNIVIDVYTPYINKLTINGAGDIFSEIPIENFILNGSGYFKCEGEVEELKIRLRGAGDFDLFDLIAQKAKVYITGAGNVKIYVEKELDVTITGVGNVYYKGNPVVNKKITGLGDVVDSN